MDPVIGLLRWCFNRLSRLAASLVIVTFTVLSVPSPGQTLVHDFRPAPNASGNGTWVLQDSVSGHQYSDIAEVSNAGFRNRNSSSALGLVPISQASVQGQYLSTGFTVAVGMNPTATAGSIEHLFTIVDVSDHQLWSVFRDNSGHVWVGKRIDPASTAGGNGPTNYLFEAWDPVDPCLLGESCTSDTLYVSFYPNGQVRMDMIAYTTLLGDQHGYDWQGGLLNVGLPIQAYPTGGSSAAPTGNPTFSLPASLELRNYSGDFFGSQSIYKFSGVSDSTTYSQAVLSRLAVWSNGALIQSGSATDALVADLGSPTLFDASMYPCNTQTYQRDSAGDTGVLTTQYRAGTSNTPCNQFGPQAPTEVTFLNPPSSGTLAAGDMTVRWNPPSSPGDSPLVEYILEVMVFQSAPYAEVWKTQVKVSLPASVTQYQVPLFPDSLYRATLTAVNRNGNRGKVTIQRWTTGSILGSGGRRTELLEIPGPEGSTPTSLGSGQSADTWTLSIRGNQIVNASGTTVQLRGVNLGSWLAQESWMDGEMTPDLSSDASPTKDISCSNSSNHLCLNDRFMLERLEGRFGSDGAKQLIDAFEANFITESDFVGIKNAGFNVVRLPFSWRTLQNADGSWITGADGAIDFSRLDAIVTSARNAGLYVILDLHVWRGQRANYGNVVNRGSADERSALNLWRYVAAHYKNESTIAGFDLLNEPPFTSAALWEDFYNAVSSQDPTRLMFVERGKYDWMDQGYPNLVYSAHLYNFEGNDLGAVQTSFNTNPGGLNIPIDQSGQWPIYIGEFKSEANVTPWLLSAMNHAGWSWTPWAWKGVNIGGWAMIDYLPSTGSTSSTTGLSPFVDASRDSYATILGTWTSALPLAKTAAQQPMYGSFSAGATQPILPASTRQPAGFTYCAAEGTACNFSGSASVAFGANGSYYFRTVSNGTSCSADVFGDPDIGANKSCYYFPLTNGSLTGPAGFTFCANEHNYCSFSGPKIVAFGVGGQFVYQSLSDGAMCSDTIFGDPSAGAVKACYTALTTAEPAPPANGAFCAPQDGQCIFPGLATVAYGNGNFLSFVTSTSPITCSTSTFADPGSNATNACYVMTSIPVGPPGYTYCGARDKECAFSGLASVAYGQTSKGFDTVTGYNTIACVPAVFRSNQYGSDGDACFYQKISSGATPAAPLPNGIFEIRGNQGNYLAAPSNASSSGQIPTEVASPNRLSEWSLQSLSGYTYLVTNTSTGLVLEGQSGASGNGAVIDLASVTGQPNQRWQLINLNGRTVFLNQATGLSLDSGGGGVGHSVNQWNWFKGSNQSWLVQPTGSGPAGYILCAYADSSCNFAGVADVVYVASTGQSYNSVQQNGFVCNLLLFGQQGYANAGDACYYKLNPADAPYLPTMQSMIGLAGPDFLINGLNNAVFTDATGGVGTQPYMQSGLGAAATLWYVNWVGDNHFTISSGRNGLALTALNGSTNCGNSTICSGSIVEQQLVPGQLNQLWQIVFDSSQTNFVILNQGTGLALDSALGGGGSSNPHTWNGFPWSANQGWQLVHTDTSADCSATTPLPQTGTSNYVFTYVNLTGSPVANFNFNATATGNVTVGNSIANSCAQGTIFPNQSCTYTVPISSVGTGAGKLTWSFSYEGYYWSVADGLFSDSGPGQTPLACQNFTTH